MFHSVFPVVLLAIGSISATQLPVITQGPVNVTAVEDSSVTFLCEAKGNPTPEILIVRKTTEVDYTLPTSRRGGESSEVSVFKTLNNIQREDKGWYVCIASNSQGRVTSEAYLDIVSDLCKGVRCPSRKQCHADYTTMKAECRCKNCEDVQFKPVCGSDCQSYFNSCQLKSQSCDKDIGLSVLHKGQCKVEEAQLTVIRSSEQIFEGESLSLKCEYSGFPVPTAFKWGKVMKNGKQKIVGTGMEYIVPAAEVKDSGNYRCIAQQCRKRVKSEVVAVEVLPTPVDEPNVEMKTCRVFGDPHIQTFDGQNYDFMGRCNYIIAVDCYMNKWMVLGQFTPCGDGVTCLEQITVYYGNMRPLTLARGWIVGQDGQKFRLRKNKPTLIGEATVTYTGLSVEVALPDGVQLVYDGFWGVQITVDEKQVTCGLCGDNNGDATNDLIGGRYGDTGNDIEVFGQSWAMWNSEWCGIEVPSSNDTCQNQEEIEERCDTILQSEVFGECTAALGDQYFRESCIIDGCSTHVERFEGSPVCALANSLAQICEVNGFNIPLDFLEKLDCGSKNDFQQAVYNSGCPLAGNPPFLDQ